MSSLIIIVTSAVELSVVSQGKFFGFPNPARMYMAISDESEAYLILREWATSKFLNSRWPELNKF